MKTQEDICRKCKESLIDCNLLYCKKFDLCCEIENGKILLTSDDQPICCDGDNCE